MKVLKSAIIEIEHTVSQKSSTVYAGYPSDINSFFVCRANSVNLRRGNNESIKNNETYKQINGKSVIEFL